MSHDSRSGRQQGAPAGYWSPTQSYVLAVITLLLGIAVGYLSAGPATRQTGGQASNASAATSDFGNSGVGQLQPSRSELTIRMVEPLLQQLQTRPNDADLLVNIGNSYYDGQDYANAIDYYQKALKLRPENVN